MKLLDKQIQADKEGVVSGCLITVRDDDGERRSQMFDHDPTRAEVYAAFPRAARIDPVTKADWERVMDESDKDWQRWKRAHAEALVRFPNPNAAQTAFIAALLNRTNAAWDAYVNDLQSWRNAT